jgi:hypothetical protein
MKPAGFYKTVGAVLLVSFTVQAVTAIIMLLHIRVPHVQLVFQVHEYNGLFMVIVAATHIVLNWGWLKANLFGKKPRT